MAKSDKIHVTDSVTGKSEFVPAVWLELFPNLVESDPVDGCVDCSLIVEDKQAEEPAKISKTVSDKGSKK